MYSVTGGVCVVIRTAYRSRVDYCPEIKLWLAGL